MFWQSSKTLFKPLHKIGEVLDTSIMSSLVPMIGTAYKYEESKNVTQIQPVKNSVGFSEKYNSQ